MDSRDASPSSAGDSAPVPVDPDEGGDVQMGGEGEGTE
jgi:hypothetical protein